MRLSREALAANPRLNARVTAALSEAPRRSPVRIPEPDYASEHELHRALWAMLQADLPAGALAFHPANGGSRHHIEAARMKALGVVPGIPDLLVIFEGRAHGLEIKNRKGKPSEAQRVIAERFALAGAPYELIRSVREAREALGRWGIIKQESSKGPSFL